MKFLLSFKGSAWGALETSANVGETHIHSLYFSFKKSILVPFLTFP